MYDPVASVAERNKILGGIVSQQAPRADMMDVEIVRDPAALTSPPISLQYLFAQTHDRNPDPAEASAVWVEGESRSLLHFFQELRSLRLGKQ